MLVCGEWSRPAAREFDRVELWDSSWGRFPSALPFPSECAKGVTTFDCELVCPEVREADDLLVLRVLAIF